MAAINDFGEMLVVSIFAIVLLVISPLEIGSTAAVFVGGVVSWTLAEYAVHRFVLHDLAPREHALHHASPDEAVLTIFLANMDLFRAGLFYSRWRFPCGRASCL